MDTQEAINWCHRQGRSAILTHGYCWDVFGWFDEEIEIPPPKKQIFDELHKEIEESEFTMGVWNELRPKT